MALPVPNAAENEDELVHGFDTTGYSQLPADHLSDSSESTNGTSCNLAYDTLGMSVASLHMAATHNLDAVAHIHDSPPHRNDAYVAHINGIQIQAATHNADTPDQNGGDAAHIDGMENRAATNAQNDNHVAHVGSMENQGTAGSSHALYGNGGHVVHLDGMEIHVYGQLAGLQLSSRTHNKLGNHVDEDDEDDSERQHAEDAAFRRAKEEEDARRLAPLPPDRCQAIKNAMQSISLGGFRPEWADRVPEELWVNRLRQKPMSKSTEN